jgi:hypothetical protein
VVAGPHGPCALQRARAGPLARVRTPHLTHLRRFREETVNSWGRDGERGFPRRVPVRA